MRVYSYSRVSAGHQARGSGLDRQADGAAAYAESVGGVLDDELSLVDAGRSAYRRKHLDGGALGRFLALAQAGRLPLPCILHVEAIDRLSRLEPLDGLADVLLALIRADVAIYTAEDGLTYSRERLREDPSALLVLVVKAQAAFEYSRRLSMRVAAAHQRKRDRIAAGERPRLPCPSWLDYDGTSYRFNARAVTIERLFELSERGWGGTRVARQLNEEGHPTLTGSTWSANGVNTMMRNPACCGRLIHKGGTVEAFYPAVVTPDRWAAAQHRRTQAQGRSGGFQTATAWHWIGQGITTCAICGSGIGVNSGSDRHGGRMYYLRCPRPGCAKGGWRLADATAYLLERISPRALAQLQAAPVDFGQIDQQIAQLQIDADAAAGALAAAEQKVLAAATADISITTFDLLGRAVDAARQRHEDATAAHRALCAQRLALSAQAAPPDVTGVALDTPDQRRALCEALTRWGLRIHLNRATNQWGLELPGREISWAAFGPDWWLDLGWVGYEPDPH